jgi:hypothetical protein
MAVVDPECRVIGVEGLRVADSSIFPQVTNGNLNGPSIMTGEKAGLGRRRCRRTSMDLGSARGGLAGLVFGPDLAVQRLVEALEGAGDHRFQQLDAADQDALDQARGLGLAVIADFGLPLGGAHQHQRQGHLDAAGRAVPRLERQVEMVAPRRRADGGDTAQVDGEERRLAPHDEVDLAVFDAGDLDGRTDEAADHVGLQQLGRDALQATVDGMVAADSHGALRHEGRALTLSNSCAQRQWPKAGGY